MKKLTIAISALTFVLGAALICTADDSTTQPSPAASPGASNNAPANVPGSNPNANANPMGNPQGSQTPPTNWTSLKGTVQTVDPTANTVQIKDETGQVLQVAVDRKVSIKKDGQRVKLSQIQTGDVIILAKRNSSPQEAPKTN
jgi:hypothetical protein